MKYDYFGNTSLRVKHLLLNFETQLILFDELFTHADESDIWSNDSNLQITYLELLQSHNLIDNKNKKSDLGTKDARVKSAPLEDFNLIKRKEKRITAQGYELLELIKNESYKIDNDFLQIDLISLFFLKAGLNYHKCPNLLQQYLAVFKKFDGIISKKLFKLLPLINNFKDINEFLNAFESGKILKILIYQNPKQNENLKEFLDDFRQNIFKLDYFITAKGSETAQDIISTLKEIFIAYKNTKDKNIFLNLIQAKEGQKFYRFKKLYLSHITKENKEDLKIKDLISFCEDENFARNFFEFIFKARVLNNLEDYCDLNYRYLNLMGIFEMSGENISLSEIFKLILKHSKSDEILNKIQTSSVSKELLNEYFKDKEFIEAFKIYGILNFTDLKHYKEKERRVKLEKLINEKFNKAKIIELLSLFEDRKNDDKIMSEVSTEATVATIFEYIVAIAFSFVDDFRVERVFEAGLSLDANLLPKSHAVGGEADFNFSYENHSLMIEVTLTQKSNQRRAEMESVSRHLGNLLLSLDKERQKESFAIFIAPYLDKNVLNDFRSRMNCYFENETSFVKGMQILPLSTKDLIEILKSNLSYKELEEDFKKLLKSKNDFGSRWYKDEISSFISNLKPKFQAKI